MDDAGAKLNRGDVSLARGAEAQDETQIALAKPLWSGCGTMEGLNKAADSSAYSP